MPLYLTDYDTSTRQAIRAFWKERKSAKQKQHLSGKSDQGERSGVTSGKGMDGFVALVKSIVRANGLAHAQLHETRGVLTLPGYFRPTKLWDLILTHEGRLVAAFEFKSQIGPSFGNNFNNRAEEAIGTAHDFWTAFREGAFETHGPPFLGWLMLLEDCEKSSTPVRDNSPHFPIFEGFQNASYAHRYDLLCHTLMKERLYTAACILTSPRSAAATGDYRTLNERSSLRHFVSTLAGHIASESVRLLR